MFRLIIAGSRTFNNYELLKEKVLFFLQNKLNFREQIIILSGRANGSDKLGEKFAFEHNFNVELYPADWDNKGKSAGYIRNIEMINNADAAIVFWDGKSKGTEHLIKNCKKRNIPIRIVYF